MSSKDSLVSFRDVVEQNRDLMQPTALKAKGKKEKSSLSSSFTFPKTLRSSLITKKKSDSELSLFQKKKTVAKKKTNNPKKTSTSTLNNSSVSLKNQEHSNIVPPGEFSQKDDETNRRKIARSLQFVQLDPTDYSEIQAESLPQELSSSLSLATEIQYDDEDYAQYMSERKADEYPVTPHQLTIYNQICPEDSDQDHSQYSGPPIYIHQCYIIQGSFNSGLIRKASSVVYNRHAVLGTRLWKNEKIVDADLQAFIDRSLTNDYCEILNTEAEPDYVWEYIQRYIHRTSPIQFPFKVLVFKPRNLADESIGSWSVVILCARTVSDELSATIVANSIFDVYALLLSDRGDNLKELYPDKEPNENFIDFAYTLSKFQKSGNIWKKVVVETVQESIDDLERDSIEKQQVKLNTQIETFRSQIITLTNQKVELEVDLKELRDQRIQIEKDTEASDSYVDPLSGEVIQISTAAKNAILKAVLGDDLVNDNISSLLSKHDIPRDVQKKLKSDEMSLEEFSSLTDEDLSEFSLLTRDRRKILALSEYVRNRIKESLQEQTKIKFTLERRILKIQRELEACLSQLKSVQNNLEVNDDLCIRLSYILNPPTYDMKIRPISLDAQKINREQPVSDGSHIWGFNPFEIQTSIVKNLRNFRSSCKRSAKQLNKTNPSKDADSDYSSTDSEPETRLDIIPQDSEAVCFAAFAVMLKHVTGYDKFLIGVHVNYRKKGVLVGPLSAIVPVRVDFAKDSNFNTILGNFSKQIRKAIANAAFYPFGDVCKKIGMSDYFPVEFEYSNERTNTIFRHAGLTSRDMISMNKTQSIECGSNGELRIERIWSMNDFAKYDLKLVLSEDADNIFGAFKYRKSCFSEEHIEKWANKYLTTLEGVEYGPKKLSISSLISRYYSSVLFHNGSTEGSLNSMKAESRLFSS